MKLDENWMKVHVLSSHTGLDVISFSLGRTKDYPKPRTAVLLRGGLAGKGFQEVLLRQFLGRKQCQTANQTDTL